MEEKFYRRKRLAPRYWHGAGLGCGKSCWKAYAGKWNHVTSQHNLEGEGGLRGILEGRYMLKQKSGEGLEPSLKEERSPG